MASDQTNAPDKAKPRFSIGTFARETRNEMAKVSWPTRKETLMTTVLIVVMALVTGVFFLAVDSGLGFVIGHLLGLHS